QDRRQGLGNQCYRQDLHHQRVCGSQTVDWIYQHGIRRAANVWSIAALPLRRSIIAMATSILRSRSPESASGVSARSHAFSNHYRGDRWKTIQDWVLDSPRPSSMISKA